MKGKSAYRYNPSYGFGKNGERKSSNYNEYHKPQISLNHQWQIDDKSTLSTVAYVSIGRGNGYNGQGNSEFGYSYTDWRGASYGKLTTNSVMQMVLLPMIRSKKSMSKVKMVLCWPCRNLKLSQLVWFVVDFHY